MTARHTFLLADLAGYSALTEAHGDDRAADVAAEFVSAVRGLLQGYDAEEVKAMGDALLIRVASALAAMQLARRIVRELGGRHLMLGVRVGLHTATAVLRDGDWFGSAVNVAARVADLARAGEVVLTQAALDAVGSPVAVRGRGRHRLKNIAEPVAVYALTLDEHPKAQALVIDPVCHMAMDPDHITERVTYNDAVYVFCSPTCAQTFSMSPQRYASR